MKLISNRSGRGGALLMFSFVLITAGLASSMSVYSGVLSRYQSIGREFKHRQEFWLAEAGLECAIAQFAFWYRDTETGQNARNDPVSEEEPVQKPAGLTVEEKRQLHNCGISDSLGLIWADLGGKRYRITSSVNRMKISRTLFVQEIRQPHVLWEEGSWSDLE